MGKWGGVGSRAGDETKTFTFRQAVRGEKGENEKEQDEENKGEEEK